MSLRRRSAHIYCGAKDPGGDDQPQAISCDDGPSGAASRRTDEVNGLLGGGQPGGASSGRICESGLGRSGRVTARHRQKPHGLTVGVKGALVVEEMVAEAVGFVGGVESGQEVGFAPFEGALFGLSDGGEILAGVQTDEIEGIA
jgi:hypothetical protein